MRTLSFIQLGPGQLLVFVALFLLVFRPLSVLVHELGHAVAVIRLAGRRARVVVYGVPAGGLTVGLVHIQIGLWPRFEGGAAGVCHYEPGGVSWRSRGWISLSGPIAATIELLMLGATSPLWWGAGSVWRATLITTGVYVAVSVVVDLTPTVTASASDGRALRAPDGWCAREFFANERAHVPPLPVRDPSTDGRSPRPARAIAGSGLARSEGTASAGARTLVDLWSESGSLDDRPGGNP